MSLIVSISPSTLESIPFSNCARAQGDVLLKWIATSQLSQLLTVQIGLHKLYYSYVELTESEIEPRTFQLQSERSTHHNY